jgi:hypothetical protein
MQKIDKQSFARIFLISKVYLGSMSRDVHICAHWLRLRNSPSPPPPAFGIVYEALLVNKDRRHFPVTPLAGVGMSVVQFRLQSRLVSHL